MSRTQTLQPKTVGDSLIETNHLVLPSHTNAIGTIFGGTIMSWIDIGAAISAQRYCGRICVTASVDALNFLNPVRLGDIVHLVSKVVFTGRTSMMVSVKVTAQNPLTQATHPCVDAVLTFVALDESGKPTAVPPLKLSTEEEKREFQAAAKRREALIALTHRPSS